MGGQQRYAPLVDRAARIDELVEAATPFVGTPHAGGLCDLGCPKCRLRRALANMEAP